MPDAGTLLLIALCLLLEGFFSGSEIALVSSDIHRVRQWEREGSRLAGWCRRLLERPDWFLATTLTGTNLCQVTAVALATALTIDRFGRTDGEWISALLMIPIILVVGEIIPKSIFQQRAEQAAIRMSPIVWGASLALSPLVALISLISRGAVRRSVGEGGVTSSYITRDGLKYVLRTQTRGAASDIRRSERDMVRRILDFSEVTVEKIMIPLSKVEALPETATLEEAAALASERAFLRIPVYREQMFHIVGLLEYFDLVETVRDLTPTERRQRTVASCLDREPLYVPETKPAKELLIALEARGERMAVVVDEYGGAVGIVTSEDILEEIVGEIDEYEAEEGLFKRLGPGRYLFQARIGMARLRELVSAEFPEGPFETLGGYLLFRAGRVPRRQEAFTHGPVVFVVEDADARSVQEVRAEFPPALDRLGAGG